MSTLPHSHITQALKINKVRIFKRFLLTTKLILLNEVKRITSPKTSF